MDTVSYNKKTLLYVGGLDAQVDEKMLAAAFVPFGELLSVVIPRDAQSGKHRGFGFVEFEETEDAAAAMDNMQDSEFFGRVLKVNIAKPDAIRKKAVWAIDADKYYQNTLPQDESDVAREMRQGEAAVAKP